MKTVCERHGMTLVEAAYRWLSHHSMLNEKRGDGIIIGASKLVYMKNSGMGKGKATMLHAIVRELVFYIPCQFIMNAIWGETGLAFALPVGELCGAVFALWLLRRNMKQTNY